MPIIALQKPNLKFFDSFLEAVEEFKQEQMPRYMSFDMGGLQNCFENFVNSENNKKTFWTKDAPVDETELWAITDQKIFVGSLSIRHKLNQDLTVLGGHIGYETRPSYRNTGIASQML